MFECLSNKINVPASKWSVTGQLAHLQKEGPLQESGFDVGWVSGLIVVKTSMEETPVDVILGVSSLELPANARTKDSGISTDPCRWNVCTHSGSSQL